MGSDRDPIEALQADGDETCKHGKTTVDAASTSVDEPALIAHRGFAGEHPENAPSAFRAAADVADWIEMDIRPTADDDPVVFHDPRLDRLTARSGAVAETSTEALLEAGRVDGGSVPTLAEALGAIPPDIGVVLDLKGRGGSHPTGSEESWEWLGSVFATVADAPQPTLLSTFWEGALAAVDERAPELPTAYVFASDRSIDHGLTVAERHGCVAVHPSVELLAEAGATLPERAHASGLTVNAWTVTDRAEAAALVDAGVDGLIADYADVLEPPENGGDPGDR